MKHFLYTITRWILNIVFFKIFHLHVEGRENIPVKGAVIVAPNHKSNWDPPLIGVAFSNRVVHYMAKEELFKNPIAAWILTMFGTFPVKRGSGDGSAVMRAVRELRKGYPVGIFPEGTRIKREGLGRFHSGMASIAMIEGTDILPVAVVGSLNMPHPKQHPAVLIGKIIHVEKQKPTKESIQALNEKVKSAIEQLMTDYNA
ncbi:lysophospholipid acyltransferase family protein [Dialister pneumosintes]|jgi:1-acyl-sn-glycerol-3-phosphate acyltransferase|uniref:Acyltransferase n=1 Tax=Dialister pneumosintes TaxID=39950 RepID=A0A1B3WCU5_9FIRM|nr:lysophospholipid acyltransferase family protein [Dialister pneumosintes]AOH38797.1 acyltransferase [Dialister pneumosintes]MBS6480076.1 1-acyl-sn-glycerol-3-phosphate acyltransferase [Dialister sp.]